MSLRSGSSLQLCLMDQSWIRSLHTEIQIFIFVLMSKIKLPPPHISWVKLIQKSNHPVQSARKTVAACSVFGAWPFCTYPRFLANKVKNSREFRKLGMLYWSVIWVGGRKQTDRFKLKIDTGSVFLVMEIPLTSVWSHCLIRHLTASKTLSLPSSSVRPLRARETWELLGEAMIPGLSNSFTLSEMFTSCMDLRESINVWLKRAHRRCSHGSHPSGEVTHLVMPPLTPAIQAGDPFKLLMRLLLPTLGKPGNQRCQKIAFIPINLSILEMCFTKKKKLSNGWYNWCDDFTKLDLSGLTNYTHFQWSAILDFGSQSCQDLHETVASNAGAFSGLAEQFVRDG